MICGRARLLAVPYGLEEEIRVPTMELPQRLEAARFTGRSLVRPDDVGLFLRRVLLLQCAGRVPERHFVELQRRL
jgi:hypothetical protein